MRKKREKFTVKINIFPTCPLPTLTRSKYKKKTKTYWLHSIISFKDKKLRENEHTIYKIINIAEVMFYSVFIMR